MKHVVSVSIGSSKRDACIETEILGRQVRIERRGTDGDVRRAAALIRELDGNVDAIGLGGLDIYVYAGGRRYVLREGMYLARQAKRTPVVCGAGLKDSLERMVVADLESVVGWRDRRVLVPGAADRFGMAEALVEHGADAVFGDLIFTVGVNVPLRSLRTVGLLARVVAPVMLQLPVKWIYPTGSSQEHVGRGRGARWFEWAEVIAGDFHFIRRHAPARLDGKIVLTNTTTREDLEFMRAKGVRTLITTTPRFDGRSLATNLLEAAFVAIAGRHPLSREDYRALLLESGLRPDVQELRAVSDSGAEARQRDRHSGSHTRSHGGIDGSRPGG